jgi:hypothetical protein
MGGVLIYIGGRSLIDPGWGRHTNGIVFVAVGSVVAMAGLVGFWYLVRSRGQTSDQRAGAAPFVQNQPSPTTPPPGWYPDPSGAGGQRYWDGTRWGPTG